MTEHKVPVWPDVSDVKMRKCPRHKCWVQVFQGHDHSRERYCPRCATEKAQYEKWKQQQAGLPAEKPKLIIKTF